MSIPAIGLLRSIAGVLPTAKHRDTGSKCGPCADWSLTGGDHEHADNREASDEDDRTNKHLSGLGSIPIDGTGLVGGFFEHAKRSFIE